MISVYVVFSEEQDTFYIGQTADLEKRIHEHNMSFYRNPYARKAKDWKLLFQINCTTIEQALKIERHLKRMKSRKYLMDLIKYPDIAEKLLLKYR